MLVYDVYHVIVQTLGFDTQHYSRVELAKTDSKQKREKKMQIRRELLDNTETVLSVQRY